MSKIKKTVCIICCLCLLVCMLAVPANAASILAGNYDPTDYIHDITISGETKTISYDFTDIRGGWFLWDSFENQSFTYVDTFSHFLGDDQDQVSGYSITYFPFGQPFDPSNWNLNQPAHGCVYVGDISPNSDIAYEFDFWFVLQWDNSRDVPFTLGIHFYHYLDYYDANGEYLETVQLSYELRKYDLEVVENALTLSDVVHFEGVFPAKAAYVRPRVRHYCGAASNSDGSRGVTLSGGASHTSLSVDINTVLENSNQMQAIKDKLNDLNDSIGNVNDKLDEILKQPEQEKNDANQSAGDAFGNVVDVVPDHSGDLGNAFSGLAASMSYDGTSAKLQIPSVSMPGIDGLFDGFVIMQPQELDFEVYFDMMPDWLLLLVQSLLTAALIIYCFKELYSTIQYLMTLKG